MHIRTEIIDGQEVTIKVYAPRARPSNRKIAQAFAESRVRKWERKREARRQRKKIVVIPVMFQPKQAVEQPEQAPL
jgi:allophanate hydrolase subunit 1